MTLLPNTIDVDGGVMAELETERQPGESYEDTIDRLLLEVRGLREFHDRVADDEELPWEGEADAGDAE